MRVNGIIVLEREVVRMGITIRNKVAIERVLTLEDLEAGDLFVFVGEDTLYLMTDYDSWFVRLPDGDLNNGPEAYWEKPVRIIHAELTIKN